MGYGQMVWKWVVDGEEQRNVLNLFHPADGTFPDLRNDLAAAVATFVSDMNTQLSTLAECVSITLGDISGGHPFPPPLEEPVDSAGASTNDLLPLQVALYTHFVTQDAIIRRGGFYLGGTVESATNTGVYTAGAVGQLEAAWETFITALEAVDVEIAICRVGVAGGADTVGRIVSNYFVRTNPGTLRSRKRGVGI